MEKVKVVAHFLNSRLVKGYTNDFFPKKSSFHLSTSSSDSGLEIALNELKALFFVKDFEGRAVHENKLYFEEDKPYQGRKAQVTFMDGEIIIGTIQSYDTDRPGFFIIPADKEDNNSRIFAVTGSVVDVTFL